MPFSNQPGSLSQSPTPTPTPTSSAVVGLCAGDFHDRWDQARQVDDLGEAALADLLAVLKNDEQDWEARWFAARALGKLDHPDVVAALIQVFATTPDDDLRQAVAAALAQVGVPAVAALTPLLSQPTHRPMAVQALACIHHPATIPPLLAVFDDARSPVRATVLDALGTFADPAILPVVQRGLADPAIAVRLAAIQALLSLRWAKAGPQGDLAVSPAQMTAWLTPLLGDADCGVAQQAIYALGRLPSPAATESLRRLLHADTPDDLQRCAVQALIWQNTAPALESLIKAWPNFKTEVRLVLLQGVGTLTPPLRPLAAEALVSWLDDLPTTPASSSLRCYGVLALGQLGTSALVPRVRSLLSDPDPGVRLHAEAALRQLQQ
ncbi:MAG: HEAT repeat domain-containing protein [Nodosilinea sp.]